MSGLNKQELSDSVFVSKNGYLELYYMLGGFVEGVFEWDGELDFYLILGK